MDHVQFWTLIDNARARAESPVDVAAQLVELLAQRDERDILLWGQIFGEYQRLSYKNRLWAAAYVINGGCSDDSFDYFRAWLTAQGRYVFLDALADPENLAEYDDIEPYDSFDEDMLDVGCAAYFRKHGLTQRDYDRFDAALDAHPLDEREKAAMLAEIRFAADIDAEWDEDELDSLLPRLSERFG